MTIDLTFRPTSYSDFEDPVALAVNGINGQMRRDMVRDMLSAEGEQREHYDALLGPIQEDILEERADESFIHNLSGFWGPSWMGGEYLPPLRPGEVEIARVVLQSTTMDVFSLRARWSGGRYHYRLVDEYRSTFLLCRKTSRRTLTLRQLIDMLETADSDDLELHGRGVVRSWWDQQREHGYAPEECTDFATVESELYPGLAGWYAGRAEAWRAFERIGSTLPDGAESLEDALWKIRLEMGALTVELQGRDADALAAGLGEATLASLFAAMDALSGTTTAAGAVAILERLTDRRVLGERPDVWCWRVRAAVPDCAVRT